MQNDTNKGEPWPQVGLLLAGSEWGTAFVAAPQLVITAAHLVEDCSTAKIRIGSSEYKLAVVCSNPVTDVVLLRVIDGEIDGKSALPRPVRLARVSTFPVRYRTWGYREVEPGKPEFLAGSGFIEAHLGGGRLQLTTLTQRPGMSGAPLAVRWAGRPLVVGVGVGRHAPGRVEDLEHLAFAAAVGSLPPDPIWPLQLEPGVAPVSRRRSDLAKAIRNLRRTMDSRDSWCRHLSLFALAMLVGTALASLLFSSILGIFLPVGSILLLTSIVARSVSNESRACYLEATDILAICNSMSPTWRRELLTAVRQSECRRIRDMIARTIKESP